MANVYKKLSVSELLNYIDRRPGMYLGSNEKRLDYLCHFLDGWFINNECELNVRYHEGITKWIYNWILKNKKKTEDDMKFLLPRYKMIYNITNSEQEAWDLFYKISDNFLDFLENEEN